MMSQGHHRRPHQQMVWRAKTSSARSGARDVITQTLLTFLTLLTQNSRPSGGKEIAQQGPRALGRKCERRICGDSLLASGMLDATPV
jgi:hypothetical protein